MGRLISGKGTKEVSDEKLGVAITQVMNMPIKKHIAALRKQIDRIDRAADKLDKICGKPEPEKAEEKGAKPSLKAKLTQMQEKAGTQNKQSDAEMRKEKGKEAVI